MIDPELDPARLAGLLAAAPARAAAARAAIARHLAAEGGYVAWSGGKDSTGCVALALEVDPAVPVCFFDSGLEFPETLTYIEDLAARLRINLHVIAAQPDALTVLRASGAWDHQAPDDLTADLHQAIITRPAQAAHRRFGTGEVWGLRAEEAASRRLGLAAGRGTLTRRDGTVALAPIWWWGARDVWAELARRRLPINPVYQRLRSLGADERSLRVGLMVDGNSLEHGRLVWLRRGWPDQYRQLLEALPRMREWS
jgi:phosphoadenosine phosphosulfate reductase